MGKTVHNLASMAEHHYRAIIGRVSTESVGSSVKNATECIALAIHQFYMLLCRSWEFFDCNIPPPECIWSRSFTVLLVHPGNVRGPFIQW